MIVKCLLYIGCQYVYVSVVCYLVEMAVVKNVLVSSALALLASVALVPATFASSLRSRDTTTPVPELAFAR